MTYYIDESILTIDHKKVAITGSRIGPKNTKRFYLGSFPMCKFRTKIQKQAGAEQGQAQVKLELGLA